jgi:hypothetical protein
MKVRVHFSREQLRSIFPNPPYNKRTMESAILPFYGILAHLRITQIP